VLTDAGDRAGREVALRMEQARSAFGGVLLKNRLVMPVPLTVIALKNDSDYWRVAPVSRGRASINPAGFVLSTEDHIFVVLNLSHDQPWRAVTYDYARLLLNYNYPPAQSWFDQGLTQYFASLRLNDKQMELGADPGAGEAQPALASLLDSPDWLSLETLFTTHNAGDSCDATQRATKFCAESWAVMHYLIHKELLPQTGAYFNLVLNQKVPVEQAIAQVFQMPASELQQKVIEYFRSLRNPAPGGKDAVLATSAPAPLGPDDVGMTLTQTPDADARATLADIRLRDPAHSEQAVAELKPLATDEHDNETAHRVLAAHYIREKNFESATEELSKAAELNASDRWVRYYLALLKFRMSGNGQQEINGLANMMQDLKVVLDWYPEFAEAYNMLGLARVQGGGNSSALDAMRAAIQLCPRSLQYVFNLGTIYAAGKKYDAARALFTRLSTSSDAGIAEASRKQLTDLTVIEKYGIPPAKPEPAGDIAKTSPPPAGENNGEKEEPEIPKGPILFVKGRLIAVDCSTPPAAVLSLASGGKTLNFHTRDVRSVLVMGADAFSCEWKNRPVAVNYRAGTTGKPAELVSVEVQ
jgi:tetratricopeptide (TPR) repeat protein